MLLQIVLTACTGAVNAQAMGDPASDISELSFEQALGALEEIVQQLESGSVPLDKSIALYERGEALRKHCQARLDAAQQKIERIVTDQSGRPTGTAPFDSDS